jgi:hypothetical protein
MVLVWALLISHVVKVVILVALLFVFARQRHRDCWSFTAYLVTVVVTTSLMSFWPRAFYNEEFYLLSQALYDVLKLLVAIEIAHRVFRRFPGARPVAQVAVFLILAVTTLAFLAIPRNVPYRTWFEWQPRIVAGTVWLFTVTTSLILWFRVPVLRWHRDLLLGFTPYLLVFVTLLGILRDYGWDIRLMFGILDSLAYLALVSWWAWAAWRPREEPGLATARARRLGLQSS